MKKKLVAAVVGASLLFAGVAQPLDHDFCMRLARTASSAYAFGLLTNSVSECKDLGTRIEREDIREEVVQWCLLGVKAVRAGVILDPGVIQDMLYRACINAR